VHDPKVVPKKSPKLKTKKICCNIQIFKGQLKGGIYQVIVVGGPAVEVLIIFEIHPVLCIDLVSYFIQMVLGNGIQICKKDAM